MSPCDMFHQRNFQRSTSNHLNLVDDGELGSFTLAVSSGAHLVFALCTGCTKIRSILVCLNCSALL